MKTGYQCVLTLLISLFAGSAFAVIDARGGRLAVGHFNRKTGGNENPFSRLNDQLFPLSENQLQ